MIATQSTIQVLGEFANERVCLHGDDHNVTTLGKLFNMSFAFAACRSQFETSESTHT